MLFFLDATPPTDAAVRKGDTHTPAEGLNTFKLSGLRFAVQFCWIESIENENRGSIEKCDISLLRDGIECDGDGMWLGGM